MSQPPTPSSLSAPGEPQPTRPALRPIPRWVVAVGIPVMVLIAVAAVWLLLGFGVDRDRLDAIRTGGTLGVGLGGAVVLWLAGPPRGSWRPLVLGRIYGMAKTSKYPVELKQCAVAMVRDLEQELGRQP